jgi:glycosyltransferase involved in cell wall biosynthesis
MRLAPEHENAMLSIVIPVFNEQDSLAALHAEIAQVAADRGYDVEILMIDDGSTDASWDRIAQLAAGDPRVRGIRFRRNSGKAAALHAGFSEARGEVVMTLDADLQDDPREIPRFLDAMTHDLDVVSGWKQVRHDPWHKVYPSRVFNWMVSRVALHDHNCGMKCYRREIFDEVRLYGELHRFVPVLAAARGYRVGELAIQHRKRKFGRSKYGFTRFVKGFLDLLTVKFITGFGQRPQHLLGTIGLSSALLGALGLTFLAAEWLLSRTVPGAEPIMLGGRPAVIYLVAFLLLGMQLLSVGMLGELFIAYHDPHVRAYSIRERTGAPADAQSSQPSRSSS